MAWDDLTEEERILLETTQKSLDDKWYEAEEPQITWTSEVGQTAVYVLFVILLGGLFFVINWFFGWWYSGYDGLASRYENLYLQTFNVDRCKSNLKKFSRDFYEYGNNVSYNNALMMRDTLKEYLGNADVNINTYHVLISRPTGKSVLSIKKNNQEIHRSTFLENGFTDLKKQAYSPYSGSGEVTTNSVIYINYGRTMDFKFLTDNSINLKGKLLLARYGKLNAGSIIENSEKIGAAGVFLYSDPIDEDGFGQLKPFPDGPLRSNTSILRSNCMYYHDKYPGDPLTPNYPAKENAYRIKREDSTNIPKKNFIVQPINTIDAKLIMNTIKGKKAPDLWKGGLSMEYMIGGEISDNDVTLKVELEEFVAPIHNVIAKVSGIDEKDKTIMIGNHRDAFGHGTTDPNTGNAVILEIAKGLGNILKNRWRPRRNIVIASWDAHELGLIGSTEYTEEFKYTLTNELVAYMNIETVVGNNLNFEFSPTLMSFVQSQSQRVDSPVNQNETLFDEWKRQHPQRDTQIGGGQDYTVFTHNIGVTASSLGFKGHFGSYHSLYDSQSWFEKFGDFTFQKSKSMVHLVGMMLLRLAGNEVLPFNFQKQSDEIQKNFQFILNSPELYNFTSDLNPSEQQHLNNLMTNFNVTLEAYHNLIKKFNVKIEEMKLKVGKPEKAILIRQLNDRMMTLEKSFLNSEGLIYSKWHKNIIYGPGKDTGNKFIYFPEFHSFLKEKNFEMISFSIQRIIVCLENSILTLKNQ